jgi:hypothetical protein
MAALLEEKGRGPMAHKAFGRMGRIARPGPLGSARSGCSTIREPLSSQVGRCEEAYFTPQTTASHRSRCTDAGV